jgi:hypothetical protein
MRNGELGMGRINIKEIVESGEEYLSLFIVCLK